jgi:hypothetical protein
MSNTDLMLEAIPDDPALFPSEYQNQERPSMLRQVGDARRRKLISTNDSPVGLFIRVILGPS